IMRHEGPSEQIYGHSAGVCRALQLGDVRREWPHPWQSNDAAEHDRPRPKGSTANPALGVALACKVDTWVTARDGGNAGFAGAKNLPPVRLDSRIGCRPERPYICSEGP
ncbi:MAG: hypothetical protein QGG54_12890, partial [Gammaproteobacteria bacterium]|nr:hypothetical protein [Gammaproteobacteria bacterium]